MWWIPSAVTAGTSLLGHVLGRGGGRPPMPEMMSDQPIRDRMTQIQDGSQADLQTMLGSASAGTGFQSMANNRMAAAQGMPGAFTARNQAMGSEARGQAFSGFLQGRQGREQMLNALTRDLMGVQETNIRNQYMGQMGRFQHEQQQQGGLLSGLGGAAIQFGSDLAGHRQHGAMVNQAAGNREMLQGFLDIWGQNFGPQNTNRATTTTQRSVQDHPYMERGY